MLVTPLEYSQEYFYGLSLLLGAVVNFVLSALLVFDPENFEVYVETPRYLRSRYMTALSLTLFGIGFVLHWWFMPRLTHPYIASALTLAYFHAGGVLFSMSHTGLVDHRYLTSKVVARDVTILLIGEGLYALTAMTESLALLHVGFALFFLHIGFLTCVFYRHFHRMYQLLGSAAENWIPNESDHNIRWMFFSCHLIIGFGIGSEVITALFPHDTWPFTLLMFVSIPVFTYIYKALENYRAFVEEVDRNIAVAEDYIESDWGHRYHPKYLLKRSQLNPLSRLPWLSGFFRQ